MLYIPNAQVLVKQCNYFEALKAVLRLSKTPPKTRELIPLLEEQRYSSLLQREEAVSHPWILGASQAWHSRAFVNKKT
jgi:hypothetical protein